MNNLATSTVTVHDLVDVLTSLTIETVAVLSANSKGRPGDKLLLKFGHGAPPFQE